MHLCNYHNKKHDIYILTRHNDICIYILYVYIYTYHKKTATFVDQNQIFISFPNFTFFPLKKKHALADAFMSSWNRCFGEPCPCGVIGVSWQQFSAKCLRRKAQLGSPFVSKSGATNNPVISRGKPMSLHFIGGWKKSPTKQPFLKLLRSWKGW